MSIVSTVFVSFCLWFIESANASETLDSSLNYRDILACGPNSLFMFLILSGHPDVTLSQLKQIPVSADGSSLLALRDAAKQLHVDTEIRSYRPEEIDKVPLPAIAQFRISSGTLTRFHFDVIYKQDADRVYLLDGTSGNKFEIVRRKLSDKWTGFAMVEKPTLHSWFPREAWLSALTLFLTFLDVIVIFFWLRSNSVRKNVQIVVKGTSQILKEGKTFLLILSLFLLQIMCPTWTRAQIPITNAWRTPANGGINVLYCYLRVNGFKCNYSELIQEQAKEVGANPSSAATLVHIAARNGLRLQPVSLTMADLKSSPLPLIVHMDGDNPDLGAFLMILSISDNKLVCVNGPVASISSISQEDFRRVWSGIALIPGRTRKVNVLFCAIGLSSSVILFFFARYSKNRLLRHKHKI